MTTGCGVIWTVWKEMCGIKQEGEAVRWRGGAEQEEALLSR